MRDPDLRLRLSLLDLELDLDLEDVLELDDVEEDEDDDEEEDLRRLGNSSPSNAEDSGPPALPRKVRPIRHTAGENRKLPTGRPLYDLKKSQGPVNVGPFCCHCLQEFELQGQKLIHPHCPQSWL